MKKVRTLVVSALQLPGSALSQVQAPICVSFHSNSQKNKVRTEHGNSKRYW